MRRADSALTAGWDPHDHHAGRDIARHDRTGAHDRAFADHDIGKDGRPSADKR